MKGKDGSRHIVLDRLAGESLLGYAVLFAVLGLGALRTWQSWLFGVFVECFSGAGVWVFSIKTLYDFGQIAGALACVLFLYRHAGMTRKAWPVALSAGGIALGTVAGALAQLGHVAALPLVSGLLFFMTGAGYSGAFLLWVEWCGLAQPMLAMAVCLGSHLVNSFLWLFLQGSGAAQEILLASSSAAMAFLLYTACRVSACRTDDQRQKMLEGLRMPAGLGRFRNVYAWAWLFTAVYGIGASYTQIAYASASSRIGIVVVASLVLLWLVLAGDSLDMSKLYRLVFAATGAGFVVAVLEPSHGAIMQVFLSASEAMVILFVFTFCCGAGRIGSVSAAVVYGVFRIGNMACVIGARYTCDALIEGLGVDPAQTIAPLAVAMAVMLGCAALFFNRVAFTHIWGWIKERGEEDVVVRRCREFGEGCGLGEREQSVLLLLAKGMTAPEIASQLLVAPGTAKAHIGHIYEKAGVHSREELERAVFGGDDGPSW